MLTEQHLQDYEQLGYFIVDDALEPGMIEELRAAARRIETKVRAGAVDLYTDYHGEGEPYHIVGLNAPEFGEPNFAEYYGCQALLDYVHGQIGTDIRLGPMAMFTNPCNEPFNVRWHRDDGLVMDRGEEDELEYLRRPRTICRWELAMVDDIALSIVPGSHLRYRSEREYKAMDKSIHERLPGDLMVDLKAGQTIFWNGDCLHRAAHTPDRERLTISTSFQRYDASEPKSDPGRCAFMLNDGAREFLPESLHLYYDRWASLQQV